MFNIGDIVRLKDGYKGMVAFNYLLNSKETHKVVELCDDGLKVEGSYFLPNVYFEIINEEKEMKKSDLRTGDVIVTTDERKTVRVFLDTENGDIVSGCTWFPLKDYSDDTLFNWSEPSTYGGTFLEVWRPKCNKDFRDSEPNEYTHKLIWKKEIKTPEQKQLDIVMQQIQQLQKEAEKLQQVVTGG